MKHFILTALIISATFSYSQTLELEKENKIDRELIVQLLEQIGTEEKIHNKLNFLTQKYISEGIGNKEFWDEYMSKIGYDEFLNRVVPIYQKYYTKEEVQSMIDYYSTDLGKSVLKKQPIVMQEVIDASFNWGIEIGQKILEQSRKNDSKTIKKATQ